MGRDLGIRGKWTIDRISHLSYEQPYGLAAKAGETNEGIGPRPRPRPGAQPKGSRPGTGRVAHKDLGAEPQAPRSTHRERSLHRDVPVG